ncbi:MAG: hypothetical protein K6C97_01235 [Treponema sp.]|nr:hypothetical protein [Treponema sp.]
MKDGFSDYLCFDTPLRGTQHKGFDRPFDRLRDHSTQGFSLAPWIFGWVANSCWLVVANLAYVYDDVLEYFVESLSKVAEYYGTVVINFQFWKPFSMSQWR